MHERSHPCRKLTGFGKQRRENGEASGMRRTTSGPCRPHRKNRRGGFERKDEPTSEFWGEGGLIQIAMSTKQEGTQSDRWGVRAGPNTALKVIFLDVIPKVKSLLKERMQTENQSIKGQIQTHSGFILNRCHIYLPKTLGLFSTHTKWNLDSSCSETLQKCCYQHLCNSSHLPLLQGTFNPPGASH